MIFFIWIIGVFTLVQLLVALSNLIFIQRFDKLAVNDSEREKQKKLVSVLVPARNEEKNIGKLLDDLIAHDYKSLEIIVFNDLSTDKTEETVIKYSLNDPRIRILNSNGLPTGWLGKNFACHTLAAVAKGEYFLFLDADVKVEQGLILKTTAFMERYSLGLVSIFPQQIMVTFSEKITVPIMNFILITLLPLILVRKSGFSSLAAANGQFMLFKASVYKKILPHQKMKSDKVEDIVIARYFKKLGIKIACLSGKTAIKCRMYENFPEAVNGFTKNIFNFFGNVPVLAVLFWIITSLGFIPFLLIGNLMYLVIYFSSIMLIRILVSLVSRQPVIVNLLLFVIQQIVMGMVIFKAFINHKKRTFVWKGRSIS